MNAITLPGNIDVSNKTLAIATAVSVTLVTGAGLFYMKSRNQRRAENEKKVEKIMKILNQDHCQFKDIIALKDKIRKFVEGGSSSIQIITDFDRTLTKAFVDGQPAHASYGVIDDSSYVPEAVVQELNSLKSKYFPIEMSSSLTEAEKLPHMIEWFTSAFQVAFKSGIKRHMLPAMVRESSVSLRDGADQFFHVVTENRIPIFVLSAGVGDVIEEILKQQAEIPPQLKLVANYYTYDSDGTLNGRDGELIHTFNKHEVSYKSRPYFKSIKKHSNVLVMGDTLGDPVMSDGIEDMKESIKIGFINKDVNESLEAYLSVYDLVLTHDANVDVITLMLREICKSH